MTTKTYVRRLNILAKRLKPEQFVTVQADTLRQLTEHWIGQSKGIRLTIGQLQLLYRVIDRSYSDSYPEKDQSVYEARRRKALDGILKKINIELTGKKP